jgi:transketolase
MRDAFIAELHDIAAGDDATMLLSADIGFAVFDRFRDEYPGRFMNMGVAEANMIGVSAGLTLSGMRPYVYTIIPFLTMRAFEQIRVDICIQNLPVVIVGVGGGLSYGVLGPTHHATEDVAVLRSLPNMTVIVPSDPAEAQAATRAAHDHDGPVYIRLGKNGEPALAGDPGSYAIGKAVTVRGGSDATIISGGPILKVACEAADELASEGLSCRVVNMHTVKPIDAEAVRQAAEETNALIVLEEHSIIGGLGSAVAEVVAEQAAGKPFKRIGIPDQFCYTVGSQEYHWMEQGFTANSVADSARKLLSA